MLDLEKVVSGLHDYIGRAMAPIIAKLSELETREPVKGVDGKDGRDGVDGKDGIGQDGADGKSFSLEEAIPVIEDYVGRAVSHIQIPKDGKDGRDGRDGIDGKSITIDDVKPIVDAFLKSIVIPKDGRDGVDGKDGENGTDGKSVSLTEVLEELLPHIDKHLKSIPVPTNGRDGVDGKPGADGKSVTVEDIRSVIESEQTRHLIELERRANDLIQRCIDRIEKPKDGIDGKDGADGLGFDDIEMVHDGERSFTFTMIRGEKRKDFTFKVPAVLERGVYRDGIAFEKGDGVTCGGNYWIALKDTTLRPGDNNSDWRLAVRKGRDGKDGPALKAVR